MKHESRNGKMYEVLFTHDEKWANYDINIIMEWSDDDAPPKYVNFYFGDYDYEVTERYIFDAKPAFESNGQHITNPFVTECMRWEVSDPIKYYGKDKILQMLKEYVER